MLCYLNCYQATGGISWIPLAPVLTHIVKLKKAEIVSTSDHPFSTSNRECVLNLLFGMFVVVLL